MVFGHLDMDFLPESRQDGFHDISKGSLLLSTDAFSALLNQQPPTPFPTSLQTFPQDFPAGKSQEKCVWCDQCLAKAWTWLREMKTQRVCFLFVNKQAISALGLFDIKASLVLFPPISWYILVSELEQGWWESSNRKGGLHSQSTLTRFFLRAGEKKKKSSYLFCRAQGRKNQK